MNIIKTVVAAFAVTAVASVYAQDAAPEAGSQEEAVVEESYGWTPIAFGLATPVQLPWGINKWDVFGLDFNLFYSDAPEVWGVQFGFANTVRRELRGAGFSGVFNYADKDVLGARFTLGANLCKGTLYGADFGGIGIHNEIKGVDVELVGCAQRNITGANFSLLGSLTDNESYGATFGCVNLARTAYGAQVAFAYNQTEELHGCQIGLVNYCRECPWGFQIGIVNIILDNTVKVLPIVNGYF